MTDNEIIKSLECCGGSNCHECPIEGCTDDIFGNALNLIKRQKAEIERWKKKANTPFANVTFDENKLKEIVADAIENIEFNLNSVKSEAIIEFAERLKENYYFTDRWGKIITKSTVDNLVKEMAGK